MFEIIEDEIFQIKIKDYYLYAIGDIHGNFNIFIKYVKHMKLDKSIFIVCGDCGFGFLSRKGHENELSKINDILKEYDSYVLCVRGNHDDPRYFNSENRFQLERIICLPDYSVLSVISIDEFNILCVGGAISIDRHQRKKDYWKYRRKLLKYNPNTNIKSIPKGYWRSEKPVYNQDKLEKIKINISGVISHTVPSFVYPIWKKNLMEFVEYDPLLIYDIIQEREVMDKIFNYLKIHQKDSLKKWYYGHFHENHRKIIEGVEFNLLDIETIQRIY